MLTKFDAVTISRTSTEFVLHVPEEYDYRMKSAEYRDILIQYLAAAVKLRRNMPLKVYFVEVENLEMFTLQEKTQIVEKQYAFHPKKEPCFISIIGFQLEYANRAYGSHTTKLIFVRNKSLLRVKLDDYSK
jgi:serum/glucocorticoid-regulated kinase 2